LLEGLDAQRPVTEAVSQRTVGRGSLFDEGNNVDVVVHSSGSNYYVLTAFDTNVNEVFNNLIV